ncbi:MAG TPA: hypothetical protein VFZ75_12165 [Actinomycetota bacterium]|nr:hypothetical protein [Actinomycetota bacterium]
MHRTGQVIFGVIAIVTGIAIVSVAATGGEVSPIVRILGAQALIGWSIYHWVWVRPAPYGVERSDRSPRHDED